MDQKQMIEIVPYRADWPKQFDKIAVKLSECLGDLVTSIDHIGSTSVPGLASKNRIDIQMTVEALDDEFKSKFDRALIAGGFPASRWNADHKPPLSDQSDDQWKKLYLGATHADLDFRSNIHIRIRNRANHTYALLFRDYLREHRESAFAYQKFKEELVRFQMNDSVAYSEIKDPVCDLIIVEAKKWASASRWAPLLAGLHG